jgi:pimeloyl-ACP methyl ester carboxylesterase
MERRTFIGSAAKLLAVSPWITPFAKAETTTSTELQNGSKGGSHLSNYTHITAPTEFVETKGIRFAYRRFGKKAGVPLVFNMHLNGNLDNWDPAVTDGLAKEREVILFDNAGVGATTGEVPQTFAEMASNAIAFIDALGLREVDVLGFSIGGMVAQNIVMQRPELVRKLVLVGTGPRNGDAMETLSPEAQAIFGKTYTPPEHQWLDVLFSPTPTSQAAGIEFLKRTASRSENRDKDNSEKVIPAQVAAVMEWGKPIGDRFAYLKEIKNPTLVVNGNHDVIVYTVNSLHLVQNLPNAKLILYSDANHGSYNQHHEEFVFDTNHFLNS